MVAKQNIKFRQKKGRSVPVRYDTETIPQDYRVAVKNKFAALLRVAEDEKHPNEHWVEAKEVVNTAAKNHIRERNNQKHTWLTNETLGVADEKRQAKVTRDRGRLERLNETLITIV